MSDPTHDTSRYDKPRRASEIVYVLLIGIHEHEAEVEAVFTDKKAMEAYVGKEWDGNEGGWQRWYEIIELDKPRAKL
jgi:hypothetical protein